MTDPQGTKNPNNQDDEQQSSSGTKSGPLDISGSFQVAQNPDAFFQGSIDIHPDEVGPSFPRAFSQNADSEQPMSPIPQPDRSNFQQNVDPKTASSQAAPAAGQTYQSEMVAQNINMQADPSSTGMVLDAFNPEPVVAPNPEPMVAPNATAPGQGGADFFDQSGRVHQAQPQFTQPQALPASAMEPPPAHEAYQPGPNVPGYSFNAFLNQARERAKTPGRVPSGFFDQGQGDATTPGAAPAQSPAPAQPQPAAAPQPRPQQTGNNMTAQQAFFMGDQVPELPAPQQQPENAFQSFYEQPAPQPGAAQNLAQNPASNAAPVAQNQMDMYQLQVGQAPPPQIEGFDIGLPPQLPPMPTPVQPQLKPGFDQGMQADSAALQHALSSELGGAPTSANQQQNYNRQLNLIQKPKNLLQNAPPPPPPTDQPAEEIAPSPAVPRKKKSATKKRRPQTKLREEEFDPGEDFSKGAEEVDNFTRFERLMTPETKGLFLFTFHQAREILLHPQKYFKKMPQTGNVAEPALFLFIMVSVCGLIAGVVNFNLLITIQFIIGNVLQAYILSFVVYKIMVGMGSSEAFEANFRVIAYSQAALIIAALKFSFLGNPAPGYLTMFIATVLAMRIQIIGLGIVHGDDVPTSKSFPVLLIATAAILFVRFKCFLL